MSNKIAPIGARKVFMKKKRYDIGQFNESFLRELAYEMVKAEFLLEELLDLLDEIRAPNQMEQRKEAWKKICDMKDVIYTEIQKNKKLAKDVQEVIMEVRSDRNIIRADNRAYFQMQKVEEMYNALVDAEACFWDEITEEARRKIKAEKKRSIEEAS